jgi:hypothetical protein
MRLLSFEHEFAKGISIKTLHSGPYESLYETSDSFESTAQHLETVLGQGMLGLP